MCQSPAEGGRRCAMHTRAVFESLSATSPLWDEAAAAYATTTEGHAAVIREADLAYRAGDYDRAARLDDAVRRAEAERTPLVRAVALAHAAPARRSVRTRFGVPARRRVLVAA